MNDADVVVLGGGLAGLAAATALGRHALVLERERRAGGLVRSLRVGEWWFDHVLHLLYFPDGATEARTRALIGDVLAPCPPEAWVHSRSGVTRYPLQAHLGTLPARIVERCLAELSARPSIDDEAPPAHYAQMLVRTFGPTMCREFFLPYNRKLWRRPLQQLAPHGFHWTIARPSFEEVVRGARERDHRYRAYNAHGLYPRTTEDGVRGMEALVRGLARHVGDLRTGHEVVRIDPHARKVVTLHRGREHTFHYREKLVATLPLPVLAAITEGLPSALRSDARRLPCNGVSSVCLCIRGPRPHHSGHWRYFADPGLAFTRLVFMHAFDPHSAPPDGWGLMAEIPFRDGERRAADSALVARVRKDVARTGLMPAGCRIVRSRVLHHPHAYVVFGRGTAERAGRVIESLRHLGIEPLGRYGRWEYSSMAQVMRDGYALGDALRNLHPPQDAHPSCS